MNTKVQKKSKDASISVLKMLEQENIQKAITGILKDDILFSRISHAMFIMHNVYYPKNKKAYDWDVDQQFSGYGSTFHLLGIQEEDDLCDTLGGILWDMKDVSNEEAMILAERIFSLWDIEIKKYFSFKNQ